MCCLVVNFGSIINVGIVEDHGWCDDELAHTSINVIQKNSDSVFFFELKEGLTLLVITFSTFTTNFFVFHLDKVIFVFVSYFFSLIFCE
jgi:hypothetical protein